MVKETKESFEEACGVLRNSGLGFDVIACLWRYDGGDASFSVYDINRHSTESKDSVTRRFALAHINLWAMSSTQPTDGKYTAVRNLDAAPTFVELARRLQQDGWNIFVHAAGEQFFAGLWLCAPTEEYMYHSIEDCSRELSVDWSNHVHKSQLVWVDPVSKDLQKEPLAG
jgi:hypothetical protein